MEDTKPIIIPTLYRSKISHEVSYPIGAEAISQLLADVAQFHELRLRFSASEFTTYRHLRHGRYEVIQIERAVGPRKSTVLSSLGTPYWYEWEIRISPVPRVFRSRIQAHIVEVGLPKMKVWLDARADCKQPGSESLAFFYDEPSEQFYPDETSALHPVRE